MKTNWQQPKRDNLFFGSLRRTLNLAILASIYSPALLANPSGAEVINGEVSIDTSSPGVTNITNSPNAIIQWQNFNIAHNEIAQFIQQGSQSAVLNRIIGENPSIILGQLISNGKVLLINPNGIVFGANSVIDTQGLIASSLNLSNDDFLKGNFHFIAGSKTGNIVNEGIIRAGKDGNIILIAPTIKNNGIIKTEGGKITLAAGQKMVLTNLDDPDISFEIQAPKHAVLNLGKILTEGGAINVFAGTITHSGEINADSVSMDAQGTIRLEANGAIALTQGSKLSANNSQGDAGTISIESKAGTSLDNGIIEAKAAESGKGGDITVLGAQIDMLNQASIDASGSNGGGQIIIGGDNPAKGGNLQNAATTNIGVSTTIKADALDNGNGGKVQIWSDNATRVFGQLSTKGGAQKGDGGLVDTSGHWLDATSVKVDASASHGKNGEWRLDADNLNIQTKNTPHAAARTSAELSTGIVTTDSVQYALNNGTSLSVNADTAEVGTGHGNIYVGAAIVKNAGGNAALNINARNHIYIDGSIVTSSGKLDIALSPDSDATDGGATTINKIVDLNSGNLTLNGATTIAKTAAIKNASLTITDSANTELNGLLNHVNTVNINTGGQLTINHGNGGFTGTINNRGTLAINAYFAMNALNLDGGLLTGSGAVKVNNSFNFHSGILDGGGAFITAAGSTTRLADTGTAYLGRHWQNFGTIIWQSSKAFSPHNNNSILNNGSSGVFNIGAKNTSDKRELNMAQFNNNGALNLYGGTLKISSSGADTGKYTVSNNGQLQFWYGTRSFKNGASLDSANKVIFANSINNFNKGSSYNAPETKVISFGTLNFNTGKTINLRSLTLNTGALGGADDVNVNQNFNFHSGSLNGSGLLTTMATTTLADTGNVYLNKHWDNLGAITWVGNSAIVDSGKTSVFNNAVGAVFKIGNTELTSANVLELNMARFNNYGSIKLYGGLLKIISNGSDTGNYDVSGDSELQFWYGTRAFDGATINSANTVTFANGNANFRNHSVYNAPETHVISFGTLSFNTGTPVNLASLTIDSGTLGGFDAVNISNNFNFHSGSLTGIGLLTTGAESTSTLADIDTVYLSKHWDNLGILTWQGTADIVDSNKLAVLNNDGIFNIGSPNNAASQVFALDTAKFNNHGAVNLANGQLKIFSPGTDTGSYHINGNSELQFLAGARNFNSGAAINGNNKNIVTFQNSKSYFNHGANFNAAGAFVDNATLVFSTGNTINLPRLTIDNSGTFSGNDAIEISKTFEFFSGFMGGGGKLTTLADSSTTLTEGIALLNRNWDNYGTVNFSVASTPSTSQKIEGELPIKFWNNFGTILWQGETGTTSELGKNIVLTNKPTGVYTISSNDPAGIREINIGAFNNQGILNLTSGILKIYSPGKDTGSYIVTGNGELQFRDGARVFNGATINSTNRVSFVGGTELFNKGTLFHAPETLIDGATISLNTNTSLDNLTLSDGVLNNADHLTVNGKFDWSGGILSGKGVFQFTDEFNYTAGNLLATGTVIINDNSSSLVLPAMPLIKRLSTHSTGDLILNGAISASGKGTAIMLTTATRLDNSAGATLSANNGRWLVYSENPADNTLGGLNANFKHYGCTVESCNDGFAVSTVRGNGLLYAITPVLSVTPDNLRSIYGNPAVFSSTYAGFIDGDSIAETGITGLAHYTNDATTSSSGNFNAGTHNIAYAGGLTSKLGYQFQDNTASAGEWTITPRDLDIAADAQSKVYGAVDPLLSYKANGLLAGDILSGALNRITGENVGRYAITQGRLTAGSNYTINFTPADLTIQAGNTNNTAGQAQEQINKQQNQVLVLTKPDIFRLDEDSQASLLDTTEQKPLKQCK